MYGYYVDKEGNEWWVIKSYWWFEQRIGKESDVEVGYCVVGWIDGLEGKEVGWNRVDLELKRRNWTDCMIVWDRGIK